MKNTQKYARCVHGSRTDQATPPKPSQAFTKYHTLSQILTPPIPNVVPIHVSTPVPYKVSYPVPNTNPFDLKLVPNLVSNPSPSRSTTCYHALSHTNTHAHTLSHKAQMKFAKLFMLQQRYNSAIVQTKTKYLAVLYRLSHGVQTMATTPQNAQN